MALVINLIIWNFILGTYNMFPKISDDLTFGKRYISDAKIINRIEGNAVNDTNNYGYLDDDFIKGEENIIVLGDSITEANQVKKEEKYVQILEAKWKERGIEIKVHNLAIAGKNAADYIYFGPKYLEKFNPEYVIIQLTLPDILDAFHPYNTNVYIDEQSNLVPYDSFSRLFKYRNEFTTINPLFYNTYVKLKSYLIARSDQQGIRLRLFQKIQSQDDVIDEKKVNLVLGKLKEVYGKKFVILYLHNINLEEQYNGQIDDDIDYKYYLFIKQYCQRNNIHLIDATYSMLTHFNQTGKLVNGFVNNRVGAGHLNTEGHRVIAQIIDDYFIKYIEGKWAKE